MALDFPSNTDLPYVDPVSGLKYIYNSGVGAWEAAIQPPAIVSDASPSITIPGFLWWDSVGGSLYVYYKDDDSEQWVEAVPSGGGAGAVSRVGATPPSTPADGELWWSNEKGLLYIYYNDGESKQWMQATTFGATSTTVAGTVVTAGTSAPSGGKAYDLWYNTTDSTLYVNHKTGLVANWVKTHSVDETASVTSVTGSLPVVVTAGTTPVVSVNDATTTSSGVVTLASVSDSTAKSQNHVLTPKVLAESINSYLLDASPTTKGLIQLATQVEVSEGLIGDKAITPLTLKQSLGTISNVPIGGIIQHGATTVPTGYLKCDGAVISRSTYSALFQAIGTTYGIGDGATTFKLPTITGTPMSIIKF